MKNKLVAMTLALLCTPLICHASQTDLQRALSQQLSQAVKQINSSVPMPLDNETRLDSAATFKNYMIYTNTMLNYTADQFDIAVFDSLIEESVIDTLCKNEGLASFIELKVIMVYRYMGKNGQFISELSKDMSTCQNVAITG